MTEDEWDERHDRLLTAAQSVSLDIDREEHVRAVERLIDAKDPPPHG